MKRKFFIFLGFAFLVCLMAFPAYAVDFKIHADINNRFEVTNNTEAIVTQDFTGSKNNDFSISLGDGREYESLKFFAPGQKGFLGNTNDDSGEKYYYYDKNGNLKQGKGDENNDHAWGETKARLRFEFTTDDNMAKGVWAMEVGNVKFGTPGSVGKGKGGSLSGDGVNTETRFLYVDFQNPLIAHSSRLRLGLQPIGLNKWLWTETAMGVRYFGSTPMLDYEAAWVRAEENFTNELEDDDAFFAKITYKPKWEDLSLKLGLFFCMLSQGNDTSTVYSIHDMNTPETAQLPTQNQNSKMSVSYDEDDYYVGLDGGMQWRSFFANWDFIYQWGDIDFDENVVEKGTDDSLDRSAYFIHTDLGYHWTPKFTTTFTFWYASGDDDPDDGDADNYDNIDTDVPGDVVIFEEQVTDDNSWTDAPYLLDKGFIMFRLKANYQVTKKWSIAPAVAYMLLAEDTYNGDDDVGWEMMLFSKYNIWKNLNFNFAAGYLVAGDAMDAWARDANISNDYDGDADDQWRVTAGIRFKF